MAFRPTLLFAIAHDNTTPAELVVEGTPTIDANDAGVTTMDLVGSELFDGNGVALGGSLYHYAFTASYSGPGYVGTLSFDPVGFQTLNATFQGRLVKAFATGGLLRLAFSLGLSAVEWLPVQLAALKTASFDVKDGKATPRHAGSNPDTSKNLVSPAGATHTFRCAALGVGNLTVDAAGVFTATSSAVPADPEHQPLTIHTELTLPDGGGTPYTVMLDSVLTLRLSYPDVTVPGAGGAGGNGQGGAGEAGAGEGGAADGKGGDPGAPGGTQAGAPGSGGAGGGDSAGAGSAGRAGGDGTAGRAGGANGGSGGSGDSGSGEDGGCSCSVPGPGDTAARAVLFVLGAALALRLRRRT